MLEQNLFILNSLISNASLLALITVHQADLYWFNTILVSLIVFFLTATIGFIFWIAHLSKSYLHPDAPLTDLQKALHIFSLIIVETIIIGSPLLLAIFIALSGHMLGDNFNTKTITAAQLVPYFMAFVFLCIPQTLFLIPAIRKPCTNYLFPEMDSSKSVHKLAIFFYITIAGMLAFNIFVAYDPKGITQSLVAVSQTITSAAQTLGYIFACLLGLGLFIRRSPKVIMERLGIGKISRNTFLQLLLITGIILVASIILEHIALLLTPPNVIEVLRSFVGSMNKTPDWTQLLINGTVISLSAGIGEELVFRGLLQPRFGWIGSNLLFTLMHIYYGPTALLLVLFIIGLGFGWVRKKWNTTASIIVHVLYDFCMIVGPVILCSLIGLKI